MHVYYSDHFHLPLPAQHRFPMRKYSRLRERLAAEGRLALKDFRHPPAASDGQLGLVHAADYIQRAQRGLMSAAQVRRLGFPWSLAMVERSRRSVGATIGAARDALQQQVAANLAGGTHHASVATAEGFCLFNDVAVAARLMQAEGRVRQVWVVDCDVHQGNGTAEIFVDDPSVFTLSLHARHNFPFVKQISDLDVELADGTEDAAYLVALAQALAAARQKCRPELIFYLAGADPFVGDALGRLSLSKAGLVQRDQLVFALCRQWQVPVAVSMAGGYAEHIEDIVDIHVATIYAAMANLR